MTDAKETAENRLRKLGWYRDNKVKIVRDAHLAGITKNRISRLTGISRSTIDIYVGKNGP